MLSLTMVSWCEWDRLNGQSLSLYIFNIYSGDITHCPESSSNKACSNGRGKTCDGTNHRATTDRYERSRHHVFFDTFSMLSWLCEITNFYEDAKNTRKNSQDILPILSQFQYHIRRIQFIVSDFYYCNYYWHGYNMSTALITRAHSRLWCI